MERPRDPRATLLVVAWLGRRGDRRRDHRRARASVTRRPGGERRVPGGGLPGGRRRRLHPVPQHGGHASAVRRARASSPSRRRRLLFDQHCVPVGAPRRRGRRLTLPRARVVRRLARGRRRASCWRGRGGIAAAANRSARRSCSGVARSALLLVDRPGPDRAPPLAAARDGTSICGARCVLARPRRCSGSSGAPPSSSSSSPRGASGAPRGDVRSTAPVARRRLGDRGRRAVRPACAGPSSYRPLIVPADLWLPPTRRACTRGIPCAATRRGLPRAPRHRPRAGGDGRSSRDRSDDLARGARSRQHDPRTRRDGALPLRPADRRRATGAPGPDRAGVPPTPRNRDSGVHRAQGRRGHRELRHPDARLRQHRP